jgi:hypothetical protein
MNNNETSCVPFTSTSGTVTTSPAAVPEPSTLVLAILGIACLALAQTMMRYRTGASGPLLRPTANL